MKKGQWLAYDIPFTIIMIFMVGIGFAVFVVYINGQAEKIAEVPPSFEDSLAQDRLLSCFQDRSIARATLGVLSWEKINQQQVNNCFPVEETFPFAYKIIAKLPDKSSEVTTNNWKPGLNPDRLQTSAATIRVQGIAQQGEIQIQVQDAR